MIRVLHVSTECYPAAKAGGMGDVVGALPNFSREVGIEAAVVIPKYANKWFGKQAFEHVFADAVKQEDRELPFTVLKQVVKGFGDPTLGNHVSEDPLNYALYCIDIPTFFDRESIYLDTDGEGFRDEVDRNFAFQQAVLIWLNSALGFDIIHCHDHQVGLIPFFMKHGVGFEKLRSIPTFYTIHNAEYKGMWNWSNKNKLPPYFEAHGGLLDWDGHIHSYASALRCTDAFNAVSETYLKEISHASGNMNWLFSDAIERSYGILNGIDDKTWNPRTDKFLDHHMTRSWNRFKSQNKLDFCNKFGLDPKLALFGFIGRLAFQKGADLIPAALEELFEQGNAASFFILGSGSHEIESQITALEKKYPNQVSALIMYNEEVAHQVYAATDFLVMPSRFEPCGLNQMFAMRYGSIPIVRATGGLIDTVKDINEGGTGIQFELANKKDLARSLSRAIVLFQNMDEFKRVRKIGINQDFSWNRSIKKYKSAYLKLLK